MMFTLEFPVGVLTHCLQYFESHPLYSYRVVQIPGMSAFCPLVQLVAICGAKKVAECTIFWQKSHLSAIEMSDRLHTLTHLCFESAKLRVSGDSLF